ncbi:MAG TPA: hypothetical protein PKW52_03695 [Nitrospira sp.]|nr:hypothetical protein [Nitrospira sp. NTP1]HQR13656.1 hypothetical protein [Nitrospira sp.]HQV10413.1 hypothetical protein [Nitrospira sp.]
MNIKWTYCLPAVLSLCLMWPTTPRAESPLPSEPGEEFLIEQTFDSGVGLLFRDYSLRGNGHVDYRTARHMLGISLDDPASQEPEVARHPLFYWFDPNQDGQWELWIDREEQGHLVDVTRYDWRQGEDLLTLYPNLRNPT